MTKEEMISAFSKLNLPDKFLFVAIDRKDDNEERILFSRNLSDFEKTGICRSLMMDYTIKGSFFKNAKKEGEDK